MASAGKNAAAKAGGSGLSKCLKEGLKTGFKAAAGNTVADITRQAIDNKGLTNNNWKEVAQNAAAGFGFGFGAGAASTGISIAKGVKGAGKATEGAGNTGKWIDEAGKIKWPPNNGVAPGTKKVVTLQKGNTFGRIGSDKGSYVAPLGTSPDKLSLAPNTNLSNYTEYQVIKNIPRVEKAIVAPWFGKPGGGIQFKLPMSIEKLLKGGYIKKVVK